MNQRELVKDIESLLGSLRGGYVPDADVRELDIEFLVGLTRRAAFGERGTALDFQGAALAISTLESIVREPLLYEAHISFGPSRVRRPEHDFYVEWWIGDELLADGASTLLSVAVGNAARALLRLE